MTTVTLTLNGRMVSAEAEPRMHLADFIRETQTLTGTHLGCEHGVCGACTVLIDGAPARSCINYAVACAGASVTTIEGLDDDEIAGELRTAFSREHALQCGFCTPGMLIAGRDLVLRAPSADEREIRVAMSGNLCRCTGYAGIVRAIQGVIADRRGRGIGPLPGAGRTELGPVGSGHGEVRGPAASRPAAVAASMARADATTDPAAEWTPQESFDRSFTVAHSLDQVWDFFSNTQAVAACLPGVSVEGDADGRRVSGKIRVKAGPIVAEFHGVAEIERDPASRSGAIRGSGQDRRSNSTARGLIRYRLLPLGQQSTQVELNVGYRLTGLLAQFSRSDLVQGIANRLIAAFAQNVEARLSGGGQKAAPQAELNAGSLVLAVLAEKVGSRLRRLLRLDRTGE